MSETIHGLPLRRDVQVDTAATDQYASMAEMVLDLEYVRFEVFEGACMVPGCLGEPFSVIAMRMKGGEIRMSTACKLHADMFAQVLGKEGVEL